MTSYSLVEYSLRQYFYLGHKCLMYDPVFLRTSSCRVNGIKIIGKIVKKNILEGINTIVSIILKIKKEDKLHDDQHLIFALAVCAGFNLKQCNKMIADAVLTVCSNGLKLLMLVKFYKTAISLLYKEGYIPNDRKSLSKDFRSAVSDWYLKRDPFLTTQQIVRHKRYHGFSHNCVMKYIHIQSSIPSHLIFILYTLYGMDKVEENFGSKLKDINLDDETYVNKQLYYIYMYLKNVDNFNKMNEISSQKEINFNGLGKTFEIVPANMLASTEILIALIRTMPLKALLDYILLFARHKVFNSKLNIGNREYIARFINPLDVQESRIHPIESFVAYVNYSRKHVNILKIQENASNKLIDSKIKLPHNKFKLISGTNLKEMDSNPVTIKKTLNTSEKIECTVQSSVKDKNQKVYSTSTKNELACDLLEQKSGIRDISKIQQNDLKIFLKPLPKLDNKILKFLSEELVEKTLKHIKPSGRKIIIAYDSRNYLTTKNCLVTTLIKVHEAITLIILSLIYPDTTSNKPTILSLNKTRKQSIKEIKIDYKEPLTFNGLSSILFEELPSNKKDVPDVIADSTMKWAKKNKKECEVFVFLGSDKINLNSIKQTKIIYERFYQKRVKIIICCLNKMHCLQSNLNRQNIFLTKTQES